MATIARVKFDELVPELFPVIFNHIPLSSRIPTILSVALASHLLHDAIIPHVLYRDVRLINEDRALHVLRRFISSTQACTGESQDKGNITTPTQYIRHICIELDGGDVPLKELQRLIDINGLPNLVVLTLNIKQDAPLPPTLWRSFKEKCSDLKEVHLTGIAQDHNAQWIQPELFAIQVRIEIHGLNTDLDLGTLNLSAIPPNLHTLELRMRDFDYDIDAAGVGGLLFKVMPHLRTLILDDFKIGNSALTKQFWIAHPGLERLELLARVTGNWFEDFESGMLPNLKFLKSNYSSAKILLPHVANQLVSLYLLETYNAQAPYLLRAVPEYGRLPALSSLGIHRTSGNSNNNRKYEGHRWREDENGAVMEIDPRANATRRFDGNYLMSIAKAAPNLEELELMGDSDDTINSITASLSRLPKLNRLTLSDPINGTSVRGFFTASFTWSEYLWRNLGVPEYDSQHYRPKSFHQAVFDLANGCRTLETVNFCSSIGDLLMRGGVSGVIIRETEGGFVKEVKRINASWGNMVGREEDW
ncbi:hypothetical protein H0H87_008694 [Tephrocybe sp. NHM501043]|nr:hypothetical protein H0H87_008694 [Tephrocybe sp. NHM501043]